VSDRTLIVHAASLTEIQEAISTAHQQVVDKVEALLRSADTTMAAWASETASRTAETEHRKKITEGVERLAQALDKIRSTAAEVAELAHEAEVKNVALLD
jgi:soluble cytochrome b562